MTEAKLQQFPSPSQSEPVPSIRVEVHPRPGQSKPNAFADVILEWPVGHIRVNGFLIFSDSDRVRPPARKGKSQWFDIVELGGSLMVLVRDAIVAEYRRVVQRS
jgi:hypothetical protein